MADVLDITVADLRRWASHGYLDDSTGFYTRFVKWLTTRANPEDWHRVALGWNWDNGEDPLCWILGRPACDKATALLLFWQSEPEYYLPFLGDRTKVPPVNQSGFDLVEAVRQRWRRGFYTAARFAFDLERDSNGRLSAENLELAFGLRAAIDMPRDMRGPLPGSRVNHGDFIEGVPAHLWSGPWRP